MRASQATRAIAAATSVASSLGLTVDEASVLHNSNKLTIRLLPANVVARIAPAGRKAAQFEIDLSQRLVAAACPVVASDPRVKPLVYEMSGFAITFWSYYESVSSSVSPADYAGSLHRLHAGMRAVDFPAPHFTERVAEAEQLLAERERTPLLADHDRLLLADTLTTCATTVARAGAAGEQLLHGEPHAGNVLATANGPVFIDLETCCRGPVEFDLAHAPTEIADHYPGFDSSILAQCRILVLAMITTWRWDRDDQFPDGRRLAEEWLATLRAARSG